MRPFLSSPEKRKTSCLSSTVFPRVGGAAFHVSRASTMLVLGLKLQARTSAENWRREKNHIVITFDFKQELSYHVGSFCEAHSDPPLCVPLHVDIQVVRVALVGIYANEGGAGTGFTPLRIAQDQSIVCRFSGLQKQSMFQTHQRVFGMELTGEVTPPGMLGLPGLNCLPEMEGSGETPT